MGFRSTRVRTMEGHLYHEVNERVNLEIMKRFEAEGIEFAFPSRTLYVKKEDRRQKIGDRRRRMEDRRGTMDEY